MSSTASLAPWPASARKKALLGRDHQRMDDRFEPFRASPGRRDALARAAGDRPAPLHHAGKRRLDRGAASPA